MRKRGRPEAKSINLATYSFSLPPFYSPLLPGSPQCSRACLVLDLASLLGRAMSSLGHGRQGDLSRAPQLEWWGRRGRKNAVLAACLSLRPPAPPTTRQDRVFSTQLLPGEVLRVRGGAHIQAGPRAGAQGRPGGRRLHTAGTGLALARGWVSMPAAGMGGLGHREPPSDSRRVLV